MITIPVSAGELVDKITILRVKAERIGDPGKTDNVRKELAALEACALENLQGSPELERLTAELAEVNGALWDIEEGKRDCERRRDWGERFVELARAVYIQNDRRAALKRRINELTGSELVEEKSYAAY